MRKLTPKQYLNIYYPDVGLTKKTVVNWIKSGKISGEQTPTGRWLVVINNSKTTSVNNLLSLLEA